VTVCVMNSSKGVTLARRVNVAASLGSRFRGLLGTSALSSDDGLWLTPCRSVHTFFMRYPIDVLFLNGHGIVVSKATLAPWRLSRWVREAAGVLEVAAGTLSRTKTDIGDRIEMKES
jgi:uncharacterized membrane protein (UPF0127 family)